MLHMVLTSIAQLGQRIQDGITHMSGAMVPAVGWGPLVLFHVASFSFHIVSHY